MLTADAVSVDLAVVAAAGVTVTAVVVFGGVARNFVAAETGGVELDGCANGEAAATVGWNSFGFGGEFDRF